MLDSNLKQPVSRGGIPEKLRESFQNAEKRFVARGPRFNDLIGTAKGTITSLAQVSTFTDTLVKSVPKHRLEAFKSLPEIVLASPNV